MTATTDLFPTLYDQAFQGNVNWVSDTIKLALLGTGATPALSWVHYSDVSGELSTGSGYTAGGTTLGTKTHVPTAANSWAITWAGSTAKNVGDIVRPTSGNGYLYRAIVAGTPGSSAPTWPTTPYSTVTDGGVTWLCIGQGVTVLSSAAATWPSSTITCGYGIVYDATTGALICLQNFGGAQSDIAGTFTVVPDSVYGWATLETA